MTQGTAETAPDGAPRSAAARASKSDPRTHVTPDAFRLDPALLGRELATPWRRGAALGLDLLAVAFLSSLGGGAFLLGSGAFLFRYGRKRLQGAARWTALAGGAGLAVIGLLPLGQQLLDFTPGSPPSLPAAEGAAPTAGEMIGFLSDDPEAVRQAARRLAESMRESGANEAEARQAADETLAFLSVGDERQGWIREGIAEVFAGTDPVEAPSPEEPLALEPAVAAFLEALRAEDPAQLEPARARLIDLLAGEELAAAHEALERAEEENGGLRRELHAAKQAPPPPVSIIARVRSLAEDIGITFFWSTLYFTAFIGLFRGRTLGKRLLGLRVVRLDGKRVSVWNAFERHGGYLAGTATGLLGFLQILWDPNRQGIQDKIAGTVVVRERGARPIMPPPTA